jgi:hypothetical protein
MKGICAGMTQPQNILYLLFTAIPLQPSMEGDYSKAPAIPVNATGRRDQSPSIVGENR